MSSLPLPVGLHLNQVSRVVERAFDAALNGAGGSIPIWLVLLNLKIRPTANQRELAQAIGLHEATLTSHLNTMDAKGLITRHRDPANRRVHRLSLTEDGEQTFLRLREAALAFDQRLRHGMTRLELDHFDNILDKLAANVGAATDHCTAPWAASDSSDTPTPH